MGARLAAVIESQRPHLALWIPVLYALGIALYFAIPAEPQGWMLAALAGVPGIGLATLSRCGPVGRVLLLIAILPAVGLEAAALRSRLVAAPVLPSEATVNVEGSGHRARPFGERPAAGAARPGGDPRAGSFPHPPSGAGVSVDPSTPADVLRPGLRLLGQARLSPPAAPSEPGGFDYRRMAWFERIGAVGYARTPMLETEGSDRGGLHQLAFRARMAASAHIQAQVPGQDGAFAAAILTGDRSGIDRSVEDALRASSLYHIVSISGLHMTLLAAAVFAILRYGLALVPRMALFLPLKKLAALAAGAVYLVISGADVATQRSYVMTATVLIAVLLDRPALTMRSVALAVLIVLAAAPESLMQAGFQMSFAATVALIAAFEGLRSRPWWQLTQTDRRWRFAKPVLGIAMTSLVAGAATAPISAFHFNTVAQYGLLANLLAVPAMGAVVMPAAVLGVLAAPLGLDWLPFQAVGLGMGDIIAVAEFIARLGGAVIGVPAGPPASLGLMALGGIFVALWLGRGRWLGLVAMALGALIWAGAERPDILIADSGRLFGIRTETGRVLSSDKGNGCAAESWLENDGDRATQAEAHARGALERRRNRIETAVPGLGQILYVGASDPGGASDDCAAAAVLIAPNWREAPAGRCLFVGSDRLRRDGALAIRVTPQGLRVEGARASNRGRPWTRDPAGASAICTQCAGGL